MCHPGRNQLSLPKVVVKFENKVIENRQKKKDYIGDENKVC